MDCAIDPSWMDYCRQIGNRYKRFPEALSVAYETLIENYNLEPERLKNKIADEVRHAMYTDSVIKMSVVSALESPRMVEFVDSLNGESVDSLENLILEEFRERLPPLAKTVYNLLREGYTTAEIVTQLQESRHYVDEALDAIRIQKLIYDRI